MNDQEKQLRQQQILDLATEIGRMATDDVGHYARSISVAAKTIITCAEPSALEDTVELRVRLSPYVPSADRVELPDGRLIKGMKGIEVLDRHGELRIVKFTVQGVACLGQEEVGPRP